MGTPSKVPFQLTPTFFGFKPSDRVGLHDNIFNLIWWGEGRWDWDTIYSMPIFLRKFWGNKVNKIIQERNEEIDEQNKKRHKKPGR